jgi:aminoglycoside phosphotransferase (APT) family kinase protein
MWDGNVYTGALDWDFAGVGPAGIDLGSVRCDAAVMYGLAAADEVLVGWEAAHGGPAPNVAWWDLISGLATPPDMGAWLPNFHAQGRTDLTLEVVTSRRDAYLNAALDSLRPDRGS